MRYAPRRLALLLALAHCGAPGDDAPGAAGVYFVPPRRAASTYPVADIDWRVEGGVARLAYTLPRALVGRSARVAFSGSAVGPQPWTLRGPDGEARCTLAPEAGVALRCDERFVGLTVDLDGVRREAQASYPAEVEARVDVARGFSAEPIGVLEVPAPR